MAGTRDHGRYNRSGLDIDQIRADLHRNRPEPTPEPVEVESAPEPKALRMGGDPSLSKGTRRVIRRTKARRARGD